MSRSTLMMNRNCIPVAVARNLGAARAGILASLMVVSVFLGFRLHRCQAQHAGDEHSEQPSDPNGHHHALPGDHSVVLHKSRMSAERGGIARAQAFAPLPTPLAPAHLSHPPVQKGLLAGARGQGLFLLHSSFLI